LTAIKLHDAFTVLMPSFEISDLATIAGFGIPEAERTTARRAHAGGQRPHSEHAMPDGQHALQPSRSALRQRIVLAVVEAAPPATPVVPHDSRTMPYRGHGDVDWLCGECGRLLAIGVEPGMFQSYALSCGCGALNLPR
jgi:hypothetical protein